jgi:sulfur carrier protein ThiS
LYAELFQLSIGTATITGRRTWQAVPLTRRIHATIIKTEVLNMKAEIKYICRNVVGSDIRSGVYDVPERATVSDLVRIGAEESGVQLPADLYDRVIFLRNGRPGNPEDELSDGDIVHVLQRIYGG